MKHILVFFAAMIVDSVWAFYIIATAEKDAIKSTLLSGLIFLTGAFLTLSYVQDKIYLISAVLGGMIGTYLSIKFKNKS